MKILYAGRMPDQPTTGGERRLAAIVKYLSEAGEKVACLETERSPARFIRGNFVLSNLWFISKVAAIQKKDELIILEDYSRRFYLFLFNIFVSIFLQRRITLVCLANAFYFDCRKSSWKNRIDEIVSRLFFKPAGLIIASGKAAAAKLAEIGVEQRKIKVIGPALRPEFAKEHQNGDPHREGPAVELLFVGRLNPIKGLEYLLDAIKLINDPNVRLTIVGDSSVVPKYTRKITDKIKDLGLEERVRFTGEITDPDELVKKYKAADILVLPSLWDTSPITIIEAMTMGLPVVATAVGGIPDWVENQVTGILAPSKDPQALGRAVAKLARRPLLRWKMGRAGQKRALKFHTRTWRDVSQEYQHFLMQLRSN